MTRVQSTRTIRRQSQGVSYTINTVPSTLTVSPLETMWTRDITASVTRLAGGKPSTPDCSLLWCTVAGGIEGTWKSADPSGASLMIHSRDFNNPVTEVRLKATLPDGTDVAATSVPVVHDGERGPAGPAGPPGADGAEGPEGAVVRVTEWAPGTSYNDGSVPEGGIRYIDVVTVRETGGGMARFQCIAPHTSTDGLTSPDNLTGCPQSWEYADMLWSEMSDTGPIYTSLLLAPNASIDFLGSQEIIIREDDGSICGRIGAPMGSDLMTIMYFGAETLGDSTYRLDCDGHAFWGEAGGDIIEVDPLNARIVVYNGGEPCTYIEANSYDGPVGLRLGDVVRDVVQSNAWGYYRESATVNCGSFRLRRATKVRVSVPLSLYTHNYGNWRAKVTAQIYIVNSAGAEVLVSTEPLILDSTAVDVSGERRKEGYSEAWVEGSNLPVGVYTVRMRVNITHVGGLQGSEPTSIGSVTVRKGLRVKVTDREGNFQARYYANGHYVGTGTEDYVMAWQDGERGMAFEAVNSAGFGIGIDADGIKVMHGAGWMSLPDYIRAVTSGVISD